MLFFIYGFITGCLVSLGAVIGAALLMKQYLPVEDAKEIVPKAVKVRRAERPDNMKARKSASLQNVREMEDMLDFR